MSDELKSTEKPSVELTLIQRLEHKIKQTEKQLNDLHAAHMALKRNPEIGDLVMLLRRIS